MNFTLKKYIAQKKNIVFLLLLIASLSFLFIWYKSVYSNNVYQENIALINNVINENNGNGSPSSSQKNFLNFLNQEKKAWTNKNYNLYYKLDNENNLEMLSQYKKNPQSVMGDIHLMKDSISYYYAVKASGQSFSPGQGLNFSGLGVIQDFNSWLSSIVFLVFFTLLCADFFGDEFTKGLRFYELIKMNRKKLTLHYLWIPLSLTFAAVCLTFIVLFGAQSISSGVGSLSYPFGQVGYITTPIWQIGLWALLYLFLTLLFITSLGQLFAVLIKKAHLSATVLLVILIIFSVLKTQTFMQPFLKWIPLSYLGSGQVISQGLNLGYGALYLIVCSIVFILLTNLLFSRYIYRKA